MDMLEERMQDDKVMRDECHYMPEPLDISETGVDSKVATGSPSRDASSLQHSPVQQSDSKTSPRAPSAPAAVYHTDAGPAALSVVEEFPPAYHDLRQ